MDSGVPLEITPNLHIPAEELHYRATRSGGPGGQHVNTSSTRVELVWDVLGSPSLTEEYRARLLMNLGHRLNARGQLRLVAASSRSQRRNRDEAAERLRVLVEQALRVPKPRKATRPSRATRAARLEAKRQRSARKRERRFRGDDE